ncbi:MAG: prepilin-type N-terminal cleavage/methylation domain-containing protein [bacterium]
MKPQNIKSFTILELLISIIILSILVVVFAAIELFSHTHVLTVDRRAKVQNDLAYIMEHSTKQIAKAIGNAQINSNDIVKIGPIDGDDTEAIVFYTDANKDGIRNDDAENPSPWKAYRLRMPILEPEGNYRLWWCPSCSDSTCVTCDPSWGTLENILSKRVTDVIYNYNPANNYVDITIQGCWDPEKVTTADDCGTSDRNPSTSFTARIKMPSVSTQ